MTYAAPNTPGSPTEFRSRYENYIGGEWVAPKGGEYFENPSPVTGKTFCEIARSRNAGVNMALLVQSQMATPIINEIGTDEQKQTLFRRVKEQSKALVIGDFVSLGDDQGKTQVEGEAYPDTAEDLAGWCDGEIVWSDDDLVVIVANYG